jgi:hypothetical protein
MSGTTRDFSVDINNEIVNIGDTYIFHYHVALKFFGIEKKVVEYLTERSGKFEVLSCEFSNSDENDLIVTAKVVSL